MADSYTYAQVVAAPAVLLPLAWITVALRCWVKRCVMNAFSADDWLMLIALVFFSAVVSMEFVSAGLGFGHHTEDLQAYQVSQILKVSVCLVHFIE